MDTLFAIRRVATWGAISIGLVTLAGVAFASRPHGFQIARFPMGSVKNVVTSLPSVASRSDLTGFWTADDGATYYVLQDGNVVWWAGFSSDSGRSFTNVYRGIWRPNNATEEPADVGTVDGEWADVPFGNSAGHGTLRLSLKFSRQLLLP